MDEAPHQDPVEWWYFNGHLSDVEGVDYSFHFVGFSVSGLETDGLAGLAGRLMHFSLATRNEGMVVKAARAAPGRGNPPAEGFAMAVDDWSMDGVGGLYGLRASEADREITLRMESTQRPVLHGDGGLLAMGAAGESYYYSRTRLAASGSMNIAGQALEVSGDAWMDHQWGDMRPAPVGWDWFSIQLDGGAEAMVFVFRDTTTGEVSQTAGTYVPEEGPVVNLGPADVTLRSRGTWRSPRTGISYPSGWDLDLVSQGISLRLEPVHLDAEFDVPSLTPAAYWEGQVEVSGSRRGSPVKGLGFAELVGYDPRGLAIPLPPAPTG